MTTRLSERKIRKMVREEIQRLNEDVDHAAIKDVVNAAQKLLAAVEGFKDAANDSMLNGVPGLDELKATLENMVNAPGSYVVTAMKPQKVVHLTPTSGETGGVVTGDDIA